MKKLSQEFVYNYYKDNGYILKSVYKGKRYKDIVICPNGHIIEITISNFKGGRRCSECFGNKKNTQESVYNYYKDNGYILNSIYKGINKKDFLTCPNGHSIYMTLGNFKLNHRCFECHGNKKYTHEFVKNFYSKYGYILKTKYINSGIKDKLICPNGHNIEMKFNNFKLNNSRCNICYKENNFGENHPRYNPNREELSLNYKIRIQHDRKWTLKNMKADPNYNKFLENSDIYVVDHVIPIKLFCKLVKYYNLDIIKIKNIINQKSNLKLITKKENSDKRAKGSIFEAAQYLMLNRIKLI